MSSTPRKRLDVTCVERGLFGSRSAAQAAIMAGEVSVDGKVESKAGKNVKPGAEIEHTSTLPKFVSRGGIKLEHAIGEFGIDVRGKVALDVGSSTGGFTHCLLTHGAEKVYAVDVGKNLIDMKLRNDPKVILMEKVNARCLRPEDFPEKLDIATVDVSFISLTKILPALKDLAINEVLALVKPQFEVGKEKVGKKGVVRSKADQIAAVEGIESFATEIGYELLGRTGSPLQGPKGNREFFIHLAIR